MEKKHNMKTEVFGTLDFNSNGSKTEERIMEASRVKMEGMGPIQVSEMDIESLVIKYHPRINVDGIDELKSSIEKCGLQEPIAVYELDKGKYAVIDGCRRLEAAKRLGWKSVPCIVHENVDQRQAAHLSYVRNMERKNLDPVEIANHLVVMKEKFGYSLKELEIKGYGSKASISQKMKILNLPGSVLDKVREGKLTIAHGLHLLELPTSEEQERWAKRILEEDLSAKKAGKLIKRYISKGKQHKEAQEVEIPEGEIPGVFMKDSRDMSELKDESVHLIVSSPPFNIGMEFEEGISFEKHIEEVKAVLKECARVLVPGGIMALDVADIHTKHSSKEITLMGHRYQEWLREHGIYLKNIIIWYKNVMPLSKRKDLLNMAEVRHTHYKIVLNFEPIYIFRKQGRREVPSEEKILASRLSKKEILELCDGVWKIQPLKTKQGHPCVHPEELPRRLIKMFSYEGDLILDPWAGSGTTIKVANELNRHAVGYERELKYKPVIMEKLGLTDGESDTEVVRTMIESVQEITSEVQVLEGATEAGETEGDICMAKIPEDGAAPVEMSLNQ